MLLNDAIVYSVKANAKSFSIRSGLAFQTTGLMLLLPILLNVLKVLPLAKDPVLCLAMIVFPGEPASKMTRDGKRPLSVNT